MDVRIVEDDELDESLRLFERALGEDFGDDGRRVLRGLLVASRTLGVFVGGRQVSTASAFPVEMTVPGGGVVPVHAVTVVGTAATHVRRGLAGSLLRRQLSEARADGQVACVLQASEASIYGRFGYGAATTRGVVSLEGQRARYLVSDGVGGHFEFAEGADAVTRLVEPVFERWRPSRPGQLGRSPQLWAEYVVDPASWRDGGGPLQWLVHRDDDGEPDGYAAYRIVNRWDHGLPASEAAVIELVAPDPHVAAALVRFLVDQPLVEHVRVTGLPEDDPLAHRLVDSRRLRTVQRDDGLWVRVVDVPAALEARRWWVDDRLVLDVRDDALPDAAGRWEVVVRAGRAELAPTDAPPDVSCGIAELGMLWLGGVTARTLAGAGRLHARSDEVLTRASLLFRGEVAPCHLGGF